jgi:spermidine synthase
MNHPLPVIDESVSTPELLQAGIQRIAHVATTDIQQVVIADTVRFGRILALDGIIQSSAADERLYHEALVQPAMLMHPQPRDVLIIGGGEGATLREVLKHKSVHSATMVDIDRQLVDIARHHLTDWHQGAFDDPRVRMFFDDGRRFISHDGSRYDVVIIDVVDLIEGGPAQSLYTRQFYHSLRDRLRPGAIVIIQALEFSFLHHHEHVTLSRTLKNAFRFVSSYSTLIPSFQCGWGFILASDSYDGTMMAGDDFDREIASRMSSSDLHHLDGRFMQSSASMCKITRSLLSEAGPIFEDPGTSQSDLLQKGANLRRVQFPLDRTLRKR